MVVSKAKNTNAQATAQLSGSDRFTGKEFKFLHIL